MTTVNSYKPLEQAIKNGETTLNISTPKFLVACMVAEICEGIPNRIASFLDPLMKNQRRDAHDYSKLYFSILNETGRIFRIRLTISLCADALKIMDILKRYGTGLHVCLNTDGAMTGEVQVIYTES